MSLRQDDRQWLIYEDETLGAVMRGLEAWALMVLGTQLVATWPRLRFDPFNGIGHFCQRVAETRLSTMKRDGGAAEVVADWILLVSKYAAGKTVLTPDVERACDELYSAAFRLDSRAQSAGVVGPGAHREAVRGD